MILNWFHFFPEMQLLEGPPRCYSCSYRVAWQHRPDIWCCLQRDRWQEARNSAWCTLKHKNWWYWCPDTWRSSCIPQLHREQEISFYHPAGEGLHRRCRDLWCCCFCPGWCLQEGKWIPLQVLVLDISWLNFLLQCIFLDWSYRVAWYISKIFFFIM